MCFQMCLLRSWNVCFVILNVCFDYCWNMSFAKPQICFLSNSKYAFTETHIPLLKRHISTSRLGIPDGISKSKYVFQKPNMFFNKNQIRFSKTHIVKVKRHISTFGLFKKSLSIWNVSFEMCVFEMCVYEMCVLNGSECVFYCDLKCVF